MGVPGSKGDMGSQGDAGPPGPQGDAGPPEPGYDLAFASLVTQTGGSPSTSIASFGGSGTTGASVVRNGVGDYTVTFSGSYPSSISAAKLVTEANAHGNLQAASSAVLSASTASIAVELFTFTLASDAGAVDVDDSCSLVVALGQ